MNNTFARGMVMFFSPNPKPPERRTCLRKHGDCEQEKGAEHGGRCVGALNAARDDCRNAVAAKKKRKFHTTFSDGCLGSHIDEERSEMRYVMRIAESSESSRL